MVWGGVPWNSDGNILRGVGWGSNFKNVFLVTPHIENTSSGGASGGKLVPGSHKTCECAHALGEPKKKINGSVYREYMYNFV